MARDWDPFHAAPMSHAAAGYNSFAALLNIRQQQLMDQDLDIIKLWMDMITQYWIQIH